MVNKFFHLTILIAILFLMGAGCKDNVTQNSKVIPNKNWPEPCQVQSNFDNNFPEEIIYPGSAKLLSTKMDAEGDKGFLGSFCVATTQDEVLKWYKENYSEDYEYSNMESIHYWKKDNTTILLDIVQEFNGGYVEYTLDVRNY